MKINPFSLTGKTLFFQSNNMGSSPIMGKFFTKIYIKFYKMSTKIQLVLKKNRIKKIKKVKKLILEKCPQKKGTCLKIFVVSPKKPNSASRKVAKVLLLSNKKTSHCYIPGIKHNLQRYSTVLIRGGRVRDLPGIKYKLIRNKFDLKKVFDRIKSRSKYGIAKIK
jgi:small subunit ribosomal protein S12